MNTIMGSLNHLLPLLLLPLMTTLLVRVFASDDSIYSASLYPLNCSSQIQFQACNATLYHINNHNLKVGEIAIYYKVNSSQIRPLNRQTNQDYLVTVPCSCKNSSELSGYFYDTTYNVKEGDNFYNISEQIYSGQAWNNQSSLFPKETILIHLLCGCIESNSQIVVTYTVQVNDTLSEIANLLYADVNDIVHLNQVLNSNPEFLQPGWVLFVPARNNGNSYF